MNKKQYLLLENIKEKDDYLQRQIKEKEIQIKILKAQIEQLYEFINIIQNLGELEAYRIEENK